MKQLSILFLLVCVGFFGSAQTVQQETTNKSIALYGFAGVGRATIETDRSAPTKFPAFEARLGVGLSKSLNKNFELRSRIVLGNRFKRKPEINTATIGKYMIIEESVNNRNHYFFEVPLLLQLNFPQAKLGLRAGGNYRQYFSSKTVDMFSGQSEFGIITGAYYQVTDKINVGMDYYFGLTNIFKSGGNFNGQLYYITGKNQAAQLTFEIAL